MVHLTAICIAGNVSMKSVQTAFPFRNTMEIVEISGNAILEMLENSVKDYDKDSPAGRFLQVSGM